jgi:hypothetical protein
MMRFRVDNASHVRREHYLAVQKQLIEMENPWTAKLHTSELRHASLVRRGLRGAFIHVTYTLSLCNAICMPSNGQV